ncbi:MAG: DUF4097 family beta strand repeat-containing protein [Elusimicrobiaceae bacterium]
MADNTPVITKEFASADIRAVEISVCSGDISVSGTNTAKAIVDITGCRQGKDIVKAELSGGVLSLKTETAKPLFSFFSKGCSPVGFKVIVPKTASVSVRSVSGGISLSGLENNIRIKSGTGSITLSALSGALHIESGAGNIVGEALLGDITVRKGAGNVELSGLGGGLNVTSGSGSVKCRWSFLPGEANIPIVAGAGDVELGFPRESRVETALVSASGKISSDFESDISAGVKIKVTAGAGKIKLIRN